MRVGRAGRVSLPGTGPGLSTAPVRQRVGDGSAATVQFIGLTPGIPGLWQANVQVPRLPAGTYPVVVTIGGVNSNAPVITVK